MIPHRLKYLWYLVAGATANPALRLEQSWWDDDYRRGSLQRTEGDVELPRHLLVAGLAGHYAPGATVLDIGCGTGGLIQPLRASVRGDVLRYVGMDLSDLALAEAAKKSEGASAGSRGVISTEFVRADFDVYTPAERFDTIIFSESLYYAPDPVRTVQRYVGSLNAGGVMIVSMWRRPSRRRVWRALRGVLPERSRSRIVVPRRPAWDVVVYARD